MMITIKGEQYTLKQCLIALWVMFDEWRRFTPQKEKRQDVAAVVIDLVVLILIGLDIFALSLIGSALS